MSAIDHPWIDCRHSLPPVDQVVDTIIMDEKGTRNAAQLKRYQRNPETQSLWFFPDGSMYVYYTPTHWKKP